MAMKTLLFVGQIMLFHIVLAQRPHAEAMLNLNYSRALTILENGNMPEFQKEFWRHDVAFMKLYLSDNQQLLAEYEKVTDEVEDVLDDADADYQLAELYLKNAVIRYFNGERFGTGRAFYASYHAIADAYEKNPGDYRTKSLYGLFQILTGSIPDSYRFWITILGVSGDVQLGERLFREAAEEAMKEDNWYAYRVRFLYAFYTFQKTGDGEKARDYAYSLPTSVLGNFLQSRVELKSGNGPESRRKLLECIRADSFFNLPYARYLYGKQLVESGNTESGRVQLNQYLAKYPGREYIRAAHLYLGWSYLIEGQTELYKHHISKIKTEGRSYFGDDIMAFYESQQDHHPLFVRARMAHDAMDFGRCEELLSTVNVDYLKNKAHVDEYHYRRGRNFQKLGRASDAERMFTKLFEGATRQTAYFQPNAALQLAYIHFDRNEPEKALQWAKRVFEYSDYPFNAPIEWQAKEMLMEGQKFTR